MRYFTYSFAYKRMFFMSRKMAFRKQVLSSITAEDPVKSEKWIKSQETRSTSALWHSVVSFNLVLVFLSFIFFAPQTFHLSLWNSSKSAVLENNINHSLQLLLQGGGNCSASLWGESTTLNMSLGGFWQDLRFSCQVSEAQRFHTVHTKLD